uniref:Uncharacterized protein n=1 Tax=Timema douglasi TaxID=61478 RepID=A0A7R8VN70_TIMDO|nr:unnamed protein product [Timema douglasi]
MNGLVPVNMKVCLCFWNALGYHEGEKKNIQEKSPSVHPIEIKPRLPVINSLVYCDCDTLDHWIPNGVALVLCERAAEHRSPKSKYSVKYTLIKTPFFEDIILNRICFIAQSENIKQTVTSIHNKTLKKDPDHTELTLTDLTIRPRFSLCLGALAILSQWGRVATSLPRAFLGVVDVKHIADITEQTWSHHAGLYTVPATTKEFYIPFYVFSSHFTVPSFTYNKLCGMSGQLSYNDQVAAIVSDEYQHLRIEGVICMSLASAGEMPISRISMRAFRSSFFPCKSTITEFKKCVLMYTPFILKAISCTLMFNTMPISYKLCPSGTILSSSSLYCFTWAFSDRSEDIYKNNMLQYDL